MHGNKLFYFLLYGILDNDRLSQRTLEDTFNDQVFKLLFNLDEDEKIRRSSISERSSKVDPDYFRQIYEYIYEQFSGVYTLTERNQYNLIRVDSTMVSKAANMSHLVSLNNNVLQMMLYMTLIAIMLVLIYKK